jgi:hypothetical protein
LVIGYQFSAIGIVVPPPDDCPPAPQRDVALQIGPSALAQGLFTGYPTGMSTVAEIKQAVSKLPQRKKLALVQWLHTQVDDRLNDEELMALAAEGARALDKREAAYAKRKAR